MKLFLARLSLLLSLLIQDVFSETVVYKDLFVFRTSGAVYSLNKLKTYSEHLSSMECFYPESLTVEHYKVLTDPPEGYFQIDVFKRKNEDKNFKNVSDSFVGLMKMIRYASSHSVSLNVNLPSAFKTAAQEKHCSLKGFEEEELKEEMRHLVLLEIFLRSRFVPGKAEELNQKQKASTLRNIRSLEESVKNQIEHEFFEN